MIKLFINFANYFVVSFIGNSRFFLNLMFEKSGLIIYVWRWMEPIAEYWNHIRSIVDGTVIRLMDQVYVINFAFQLEMVMLRG